MSFTAPSRERARPALPLAGMVDILFLLIIFFMTTSVFRQQERTVEIELPETPEKDVSAESERSPFVATVTRSGEIYLGARQHTLPTFRKALGELTDAYPERALIVRGDAESQLERVVQVVDAARAVGVGSVEIATARRANTAENGS